MALACALLAPLSSAAAQVRGRVVDDEGRPLPGVLVELWSASRRLAGDGSDARGYFRLDSAGSGSRVLVARAIGLDPLRRPLGPNDTVVTLVMQPRAIELSAATVRAEVGWCPAEDDATARRLWERAARHYDVALSAMGVSTNTQLFTAIVPPEQLGVIDTSQLRETFILGASNPAAFAERFLTQPNFYAIPASRIPYRRFGRWIYPLLESTRAWHFADSLFGAMNRMALMVTATRDTVIAFCSMQQRRPYIQGWLRVAEDTTLASAEWVFVTPQPREEAGGRVIFAPVDPEGRGQPLLPVAGLYWRKLMRLIYQEWMEYRRWDRCESFESCRSPRPFP